jgi:hypothetical protein
MEEPMSEEPTPTPSGDHVYRGRVLPGSRWKSRGTGGHGSSLVTVLRVGQRSALVVIEGGTRGVSSHRAGRRYNVPLDSFLITHELVSQPNGYKPGDELLPRPKTDTVEKYFDRNRYVDQVIEQIEQNDVRDYVTDSPVLPPNPQLPPSLQRIAGDSTRTIPTPPKEEPMQPIQTGATTGPAENTPVPTTVLSAPEPEPEPAEEQHEADPVEMFMQAGHLLLEGINSKISAGQAELDRLLEATTRVNDDLAKLRRQKDRIEAAVLAAISPEEPEPPASEPEPEPAPKPASPGVTTYTDPGGTVRHRGTSGFVAAPGKLTQRDWILGRAAQQGGISIQKVVDEFATEYGITREQAIKNISSLLAYQTRDPKPDYPTLYRVSQGVYTVATTVTINNP